MNFRRIENEARFSLEKMQKTNLFDTKNFFCDVYGLEPGQEQKPHSHSDADKVYYVAAGTGVFESEAAGTGVFVVGEEKREASAGEVVFAPSGLQHGVSNPGDSRLTLLVFMSPNPNH